MTSQETRSCFYNLTLANPVTLQDFFLGGKRPLAQPLRSEPVDQGSAACNARCNKQPAERLAAIDEDEDKSCNSESGGSG